MPRMAWEKAAAENSAMGPSTGMPRIDVPHVEALSSKKAATAIPAAIRVLATTVACPPAPMTATRCWPMRNLPS